MVAWTSDVIVTTSGLKVHSRRFAASLGIEPDRSTVLALSKRGVCQQSELVSFTLWKDHDDKVGMLT